MKRIVKFIYTVSYTIFQQKGVIISKFNAFSWSLTFLPRESRLLGSSYSLIIDRDESEYPIVLSRELGRFFLSFYSQAFIQPTTKELMWI